MQQVVILSMKLLNSLQNIQNIICQWVFYYTIHNKYYVQLVTIFIKIINNNEIWPLYLQTVYNSDSSKTVFQLVTKLA